MTCFAMLRRLGGVLLLWALVLPLRGTEPGLKRFALPGGDAAATLKLFVDQSGSQVVYLVDLVRGVATRPVRGRYPPLEALRRMLAGTPLSAVEDARTGALTVGRNRPPAGPVPPVPPGPAIAPDPLGDEVVRLNPFEVNASRDHGYGALQSNALTSFRMDLQRMPVTAQVFTQAFMDDTASTSIETMLVDYSGTVGYNPNNAGAALDLGGDRDGGQGLGIRGLQASGVKRDGFIGMRNNARTATGNTDNFSIERVELIEGPQSLLYGAVGGGGVINAVSKRANFRVRGGLVRFALGHHGDQRATFDYNYGEDAIALRVAGVHTRGATERFNLSNEHDFAGIYAQVAARPVPWLDVRLTAEHNDNLAVFNNDPNLDALLAPDDPRRGQNSRYLALTGQLANLTNLFDGGLNFSNFSSLFGWWQSEKIRNDYANAVVEARLAPSLSARVIALYSETLDLRSNASNNKALLPALTGGNPFTETAVQLTNAGFNEQQDRTKGVQVTLLHEHDFKLGRLAAHAQTAVGAEFSHQGPSFGSSGFDYRYYQVDGDGNTVINPLLTQDYGRIPMPPQYWSVQHGIPTRPLFDPFARQVTLNGVTYVAQRRILYDPARATAADPYGLIPNNPTAANPGGFSGNWNPGGDTGNRLVYLANVTDWADGRLTTVAGVSVNTFGTQNFGPTSTGPHFTVLPKRDYWGYTFGANAALPRVPGLRFYATASTAGLPGGTARDYYGRPLRTPNANSPQPEIGLKWTLTESRLNAQLYFDPATAVRNEAQNAGGDIFNAINPRGINGRYNQGDQWINVDRRATAAGLVVTAMPTRNWRLRFSATHLGGQVENTVSYAQLYNDQFRVQAGTVTYADGSPVLVDPAGGDAPGSAPLTLAMINDPRGPFYASPDPDSGRITNPALISVLTAVDPTRGQAATGVTGLPLSAIQYDFANPHGGVITVVNAGEKNTGINEYSLNFQSHYACEVGALRGVALFVDVRATLRNRAYYTLRFPAGSSGNALQGARELYRLPDQVLAGIGISYTRRLPGVLRDLTWTTQLNIRNLFDHSEVIVMPNPANAAQLRARLSAPPRQFVWTNTIRF